MPARWLLPALLVVAISPAAVGAQPRLSVGTVVASGFDRPVQVTHAGDGSGRLFVVEQSGRVRIVQGGAVLPPPFLDLSSLVTSSGERGLLGIAFHPSYDQNGFFYVNYTDLSGNTVVARYNVSGDPNVADPSSAMTVLAIAQPFPNHNGGQLHFGPFDGYLYIGMGDGGSFNDPAGNAQNKNTLLGAMLRLDVDGGTPYAIPFDNPYLGIDGADETWSIGLRNPWRFSFDRGTGDLLLGDVGQGTWEEIDFQPAGSPGGENYGWADREGPCSRGDVFPCPPAAPGLTDPIAYYGRSEGRSVTGGYVYRGSAFPALVGRYFYADFVSGRLWSLSKASALGWGSPQLELFTGVNVSAFGEDEQGELYLVDYSGGTIRKLQDGGGAWPPTTRLSIDTPGEGAHLLQPFTIAGWAIDPSGVSGTGVDDVHVWAFPDGGGGTFVGIASYGSTRTDVGAFFGSPRFDDSGYSLDVSGLPDGGYTLGVYAHSDVRGTFDGVATVHVTVGSLPAMNMDAPVMTSRLPFKVEGWAVDRAAPSGSGVDEVHVWAYRADDLTGTFLGVATTGVSRPDVASVFGAQFANAGWELMVTTSLPETTYHIVAYAKSTVSGTFNNESARTVLVLPPLTNPAMAVDLPAPGSLVSVPFDVAGWAIDLGTLSGTGVDEVHLWAFPTAGTPPSFLGVATYGGSRPDVGAVFGSRFTDSAYELNVTTPLAPGIYDVRVYAHSTVSGSFNNVRTVRVTVQ